MQTQITLLKLLIHHKIILFTFHVILSFLFSLSSGKTPEEADRLFLNNARKLALYGVDLHKVKVSYFDCVYVCVLFHFIQPSMFTCFSPEYM